MKSYTVTLQPSGDLAVTIPKELLNELNIDEGTEARVKVVGDHLEVDFLTDDVELNLTESELAYLAEQAHLSGMTLNEYVNDFLEELVEGVNSDAVAVNTIAKDILSKIVVD